VNEPIEQTRGIDTLVPHPRNYNQHPPAQIERLAASLRQFGQVRPIVVHGDTIVAGHGVYMAAQHLGYQTLRVTHLPDDWTDEQAMAYLVADNETRRGAEPSDTELAALLDELQQQDFDLDSLGFDEVEYGALLDGLTPELPEPGNGGDEFEPDDAAPCRVQTGDVWLIGGVHRLICGDCTDPATVERLMQGERADAVVTDPPYSSGGFTRGDRTLSVAEKYIQSGTQVVRPEFSGDNRDQRSWIGWCERWLSLWIQVLNSGASIAIWTDWRQLPATTDALQGGGYVWRGVAVWDKTEAARPMYGRFRPQAEYLVWGSVGSLDLNDGRPCYPGVFTKSVDSGKLHITQKPVDVGVWSMSMVPEDALVLDPFLGSGTTIIAAHRTGRRCYGCEISEAYCEVILQRCEAEGLTVGRVSTAAVDEGANGL
jgi:site-specific DNA-methyltransferase (adenine-specific)